MEISSIVKIIILLISFINNATNSHGYRRKFPKDFSFGVATASYQIEGGWNEDEKGKNIWDILTHNTDLVIDKSTGDIACDSYHLHETDVSMLTELGVNHYRFSLSWSRILPSGFSDKINQNGINYYNKLINDLIKSNINPVVTIYHWDLPQPLQALGGWTNPLMANYYTDYANIVFKEFGDRVKLWLTFNEPLVFCPQGYDGVGKAPAVNMSGIGGYLCGHTVLKAHAKAYHLYNDIYRPEQQGKISLTLSGPWYEPNSDSKEDEVLANTAMQFDVGWFGHPIFSKDGDYPNVMKTRIRENSEIQGYQRSRLPEFTLKEIEYIKGTYDFFGLNHYTSYIAKDGQKENATQPSFENDKNVLAYQNESWPDTASSWLKVVPWGFTKILKWIRTKYGNPEVMIFENGFSDKGDLNDEGRINYMQSYINAMLDAIDDGCNVTTYTVWSLMDNMEWLKGYTERYGLYYVDFDDPKRKRTPKTSALFYADVIQNKSVESMPKRIDDDFDLSELL